MGNKESKGVEQETPASSSCEKDEKPSPLSSVDVGDKYTEEEKEALRNNKFVVLPCYPNPFAGFGQSKEKGGNDGEKLSLPSWESIVNILSKPISDPAALTEVLKELTGIETTYFVERFKDPSSESFRVFFEGESSVIVGIQGLVLRMPTLFPDPHSIPLLIPQVDQSFSLSREQIACLLAATFFNVLEGSSKHSLYSYSSFGFDVLYASNWGTVLSTLECIIHYFTRVTQQMPEGKLTFHRQVMPPREANDWASSTTRILKVQTFDEGIIEDSPAPLHVDFANANIGGGVSRGGSAQEEILFATKTECIISQLFCAELKENEVLFITGAERFSAYTGYSRSFTWAGNFNDTTPRDADGTIQKTITAMDAVRTFGGQFDIDHFHRDLNKAFNGFSYRPNNGAVATGNWGCGVFGGDKSVKFFQQLLAASEAGREGLMYYTFNEDYYEPSHKLSSWIAEVMQIIEKEDMTVGEVYACVLAGLAEAKRNEDMTNLFDWFKKSYQS